MLAYVILAVLFFCTLIIISGAFRPINVSARSFRIIRTVIYILAVIFSTQVVLRQNSGADLVRQFAEIDTFRLMGKGGFATKLKGNFLLGKDFLFYLVSLQSNNMLLLAVAALITYGATYFLRSEEIRHSSVTSYAYALSFFVFTSVCTFVNVTNSVRYPMACAIESVGVYLYSKNKGIFAKWASIIATTVMAISIHQGTIMLAGLLILAVIIKKDGIRLIVLIVGMLACSTFGKVLSAVSNPYLRYIGKNITSYLYSGTLDSRSFGIACFLFAMMLTALILNCKEEKENSVYLRFVKTLAFMSFACVSSPILSQRLLLAASINSLALMNKTANKNVWKSKMIGTIGLVGLGAAFILICYYDFYVFNTVYMLKG